MCRSIRRSLPNAPRPSPLLQLKYLSPHSLGMLHAVFGDIFGIPTPQPFQYVEACHYICNDDTVLVVSVCTADGKALIVQLAGFFYRGVVFYKDPFLDLATARVERATATDHNIEGYHGDKHKHKHEDQRLLIKRLNQFNKEDAEATHVVINLLVRLRLTTGNVCCPILERLVKRSLVS